MRILVIGNLIIDTILTTTTLPWGGKAFIEKKAIYVGGQGANGAGALALLGCPVGFLTRVGDDLAGQAALEDLRGLGISVENVLVTEGADTMTATIIVESNTGERSILMHQDPRLVQGRPVVASDQGWIEAMTRQYDLIYLDGYHLDIALPVAQAAARAGIPVLSDLEQVTPATRALLPFINILIAPAASICAAAGVTDPAIAITRLLNRTLTIVIATCGPDGAHGASSDKPEPIHVPAAACSAIDTTGAGDAFHGGYIAALAKGLTMVPAMQFASQVAAAACESAGPRVAVAALKRRGLIGASEERIS